MQGAPAWQSALLPPEVPDGLQRGKVFVINLRRRLDRRAAMESVCAQADEWLTNTVEWIPAVDSQELTWSAVAWALEPATLKEARELDSLQGTPELCTITAGDFQARLTRGAVACALSHRTCWHRLQTSRHTDWALVMEDDVEEFCPGFSLCVAKLVKSAPPDWDIIYLGYHQGESLLECHFPGVPVRVCIANHVVNHKVTGATEITGLYGYLVSKAGAQKLLARLFPISMQVDSAIYKMHAAGQLTALCVDPSDMLLYSPPTEMSRDTDIQTFGDFTVSWGQLANRGSVIDGEAERFFVIGDWTGYKNFEEMAHVGDEEHSLTVSVPASRRLRFHLALYRDWDRRIHPAEDNAGPFTDALGPHDGEDKESQRVWLIDGWKDGFACQEGDEFDIILHINGARLFVTWIGPRKHSQADRKSVV